MCRPNLLVPRRERNGEVEILHFAVIAPATAAKQPARRSTGNPPQRIPPRSASDALHVRRPPRINLVSDALTWRAPTAGLCPHHATCACLGLSTQRAYVHTCRRCTRTLASCTTRVFLSKQSTHVTVRPPTRRSVHWRLGPGSWAPTRHGEKARATRVRPPARKAFLLMAWTERFDQRKPMRPTKRC